MNEKNKWKFDEWRDKLYESLVLGGGNASFSLSGEDLKNDLVERLVGDGIVHTVESNPVWGWQVQVPKLEDR